MPTYVDDLRRLANELRNERDALREALGEVYECFGLASWANAFGRKEAQVARKARALLSGNPNEKANDG